MKDANPNNHQSFYIFFLCPNFVGVETLQAKIKTLPNKPGIYQFKNRENKIIYIGKAKNLKKRVASYFAKNHYDSGKTRVMVRKIEDLSFIVVDSELDALLLENSLIKKHQPRYNIQLKDDKTFPWLCIKNERFPRIFSTRNPVEDGSEYFGPYASVKMMKTLLGLIRKLYPLRTCNYDLSKENISSGKFKVCLEYHIGNCKGPCEGKEDEKTYNRYIEEARNIIKGNLNEIIKRLKQEMRAYADQMAFEQANDMKNKLEVLEKYQSKSTIVNPKIDNVDVFNLATDANAAYINYFRISNGAIIQSNTLEIKKRLDESEKELLTYAIPELRQKHKIQCQRNSIAF